MRRIEDLVTCIIKVGRQARAGSRGAWRAEQVSETRREIWHYAHKMAVIESGILTIISKGWNSASDKRGLRALSWSATKNGLQVAATTHSH